MPLKIGVCLIACFFFQTLRAQTVVSDTLTGTDSASITANPFGLQQRSLSTASIKRYQTNVLQLAAPGNLVTAFNTLPGIRMEERSPGSYRLNIRGSSLRSPFGVRNIKMYYNNLPLTDAGGNTYFNQMTGNSFSTATIVRGPASSMYGAGTGGLVLMEAISSNQPTLQAEYSTGSYGLLNVLAAVNFGQKDNRNRISYAHNESRGYRDQTAMRRDQMAWTSQLKASDRQTLTATMLYTNMYYQTPGGLTLAEYHANAKAARPAGGGFPSAQQVNAAIYQQNLLAGISSQLKLNSQWSNTTALYGSFASIKNSAIRNYENRSEPHVGARTVFTYEKKLENSSIKWQSGAEFQAGFFNTQVSRNKLGQRDSLLTNDDQTFYTGFAFTQVEWVFQNGFYANAGASLNINKVKIARLSSLPIVTQERTYNNEVAPRISAGYKWKNDWETQVTVSKGFSPPTVSELLPSTGRISTDLEAETGYNVELSQTIRLFKTLSLTSTGFIFNLNNTLVQQRDLSGGDFYINAGSTRQAGIETVLDYVRGFMPKSMVQFLNVSLAHTYSAFTYNDYNKLGVNYKGNQLPGVPKNTVAIRAMLQMKYGFYFNANYYHNSSIMLNDANTFRASSFQVVGAKAGYKGKLGKKQRWHVFAGAENLFDTKYSLGNDINAAANRFFNVAPGRTWYAGIGIE